MIQNVGKIVMFFTPSGFYRRFCLLLSFQQFKLWHTFFSLTTIFC